MANSSIFHFFARLLLVRDKFCEVDQIEDCLLPQDIIAACSKAKFPDYILRTNPSGEQPGGELIEMKESISYQISSFNSTIPSAQKHSRDISKSHKIQLESIGESVEYPEFRDVYYLICGRDKSSEASKHTKLCLVSGKFFSTMPVSKLLMEAFSQVATEAGIKWAIEFDENSDNFLRQEHFARTRRVDGAAVKVRFRVMAETLPETNLLSNTHFSQLGDDTISLIVPEDDFQKIKTNNRLRPWNNVPNYVSKVNSFKYLSSAIREVDLTLNDILRVGVLQHPIRGKYLLVQADLNLTKKSR